MAVARLALPGLAARSPLLRFHGDQKLIAMTRAGRDAALAALVERHGPHLVAFCRHSLCSEEDPSDVLREVRACARRALREHSGPIAAKPLLYRAARRRCLDIAGEPERDEPDGVAGDVSRLPEELRTALLLREQGGLSYREIATAMETTVATVKALLVHARVSVAEARVIA